jgi:uncharacterized protein (DUF488 family)
MPTVFTIGHSNHPFPYFLELLQTHGITCLVDVRSVAASAYNPQFNGGVLAATLKTEGIAYLHFAREFGARHDDPALLDAEGRVDFGKVQRSVAFRSGVERLKAGAEKGHVIALMCSEADPLECHRFAMVSSYLDRNGFDVRHILKDKTLLTNAGLEELLLKKYAKKLPQPSLFEAITPVEQLAAAYRMCNREIGYVVPTDFSP